LNVVTDIDGVDAREVPATFVAVTVNVYAVPFVSPVTAMVPEPDWDRVPVPPAGFEVAVYAVIGDPPSDEGAVNAISAVVPPVAATAPMPGLPGVPRGVADCEGPDAAEVPALFVAVAVNVYAVPLVSPVTSQDPDAPDTVHVLAALPTAVTLYDAGVPPAVGAATVTVTLPSPTATVGLAGAPGAARTSTAPLTVVDGGEVYEQPLAVTPVTMNVLFARFVRPRTWIEPLDAEVLIVALWPVFDLAVNVVQGDVYVGAVKTTVRVTPPTAAVAVHEFLAASHPAPATSPRTTGALTSDALSPELPHPVRSITAHTTMAVALPEPDARLVKRLVRAPIANTIPLGDVAPSTCEPVEGYCRSGGSATVKTRWFRRVPLQGSMGLAQGDDVRPFSC
jgi:hypothetical protein